MKLYNTLSGTTEPFTPGEDVVKMYVCGVTPYAQSHVGHAMNAVVFDVVRRYLEFRGHTVRHVENFTDIDDKMIKAAAEQGKSVEELARKNIELHQEQMDALNVLRAHVYPRATQEIPKIQKIIGGLVEAGFAYASAGDVFFRVRRSKEYGKLSHRSLDAMRSGARVEVDLKKEDPMDFVLWKSQKPGEPAWDSPWGPGRPGWHIECSAMTMRYLGPTIDIHGGGQDLVFPHHENEIAQSESYTDKQPMARFWVHNGLLRLGEDKMSKSLGNFITVGEALRRFSSDALRMFFLSSHYRSPLTYSAQAVGAQVRAVARLRNAARADSAAVAGQPLDAGPYVERFVAAMDEDLNTPRALATLFDLARQINGAAEGGRDVSRSQETLRDLAGVLGLTLQEPSHERGEDFFPLFHLLLDTDAELRAAGRHDLADGTSRRLLEQGIDLEEVLGVGNSEPVEAFGGSVAAIVDMLIESRSALRAAGRYDIADRIRRRLAELGFTLEDTPRGTEWKRHLS